MGATVPTILGINLDLAGIRMSYAESSAGRLHDDTVCVGNQAKYTDP